MHTALKQTSSTCYWAVPKKQGKDYRLTFQKGSFPFNYITSIVKSLLSSYHSSSKTFFPRQHRLHEVGKLPENLTFAFRDESLCFSLSYGNRKENIKEKTSVLLAKLSDACQHIISFKIQFFASISSSEKNPGCTGDCLFSSFICTQGLQSSISLRILTSLLARTCETVTVIMKVHTYIVNSFTGCTLCSAWGLLHQHSVRTIHLIFYFRRISGKAKWAKLAEIQRVPKQLMPTRDLLKPILMLFVANG